jgi:HSP20 family protein
MQQTQPQTQEIPVKVYRAAERVTIAAPMPGLEPQDIKVTVQANGPLMLHGELRGMLKGENDVLMDEWTPGPYHREVDLKQGVDGPTANVTYNNGVLVVVLPLAGKTTPAELSLGRVSATQGETVGHQGQDMQPPGSGQNRAS